MRIYEIQSVNAEKVAVNGVKQAAKRAQQQATAAQARLKIKTAQQQLSKLIAPVGSKGAKAP